MSKSSKCDECGSVSVSGDDHGTERCLVCTNCGMVQGSQLELTYSDLGDGRTVPDQDSTTTNVSVEFDMKLRTAQARNNSNCAQFMPKRIRFGAPRPARSNPHPLLKSSPTRQTDCVSAAHREALRATKHFRFSIDLLGKALQLFDETRDITGRKSSPRSLMSFKSFVVVCLYSVAKAGEASVPTILEASAFAGISEKTFRRSLKRLQTFLMKESEASDTAVVKDPLHFFQMQENHVDASDEPELAVGSGQSSNLEESAAQQSAHGNLLSYSWIVAAKTFDAHVDLRTFDRVSASDACKDLQRQLYRVALQLEKFSSTRLHLERFGTSANVVHSIYVYLAYSVWNLKRTVPVSFVMPCGHDSDARKISKFCTYFDLHHTGRLYRKFLELVDGLVEHAQLLSWVKQCDRANVLRHVEAVLERYDHIPVALKPLPTAVWPIVRQDNDTKPILHDIYREELCDADATEAELLDYLKTPGEIEFCRLFEDSQ